MKQRSSMPTFQPIRGGEHWISVVRKQPKGYVHQVDFNKFPTFPKALQQLVIEQFPHLFNWEKKKE